MTDITELLGKTLSAIEVSTGEDEILFTTATGARYRLYHGQSCCEYVRIEDICGDLDDLIGAPILLAEEVVSENETPDGMPPNEDLCDSYTWTFHKLATIRGSVALRWLGESNGRYSESVDFERFAEEWEHIISTEITPTLGGVEEIVPVTLKLTLRGWPATTDGPAVAELRRCRVLVRGEWEHLDGRLHWRILELASAWLKAPGNVEKCFDSYPELEGGK